jgi:hypothetical protein
MAASTTRLRACEKIPATGSLTVAALLQCVF